MSYVLGWTAYYADATYSSVDTPIATLPTEGMQVWMLYFRDGTRRILHGNEYYFWCDNGSDDGIYGQSDNPPTEIAARYPGAYIIAGQLLDDAAYSIILSAAMRRKEP